MALSTWTDLKARIANYLKGRNDIDDRIEEFIDLAEKRIYRELRVQEMISTTEIAAASEMTLPTDFLEALLVELQSDPKCRLVSMEAVGASEAHPFAYTGRPTSYRIRGEDTLLLFPSPQETTNVLVEYFAKPTALSASNETNAVFPKYSDLFLYAAMLEASNYTMNDERIATWGALLQKGLDQANQQANRTRTRGATLRRPYGSLG